MEVPCEGVEYTFQAPETTTFTLVATGPGGTAESSATLYVEPFREWSPIGKLRASKGVIASGEDVILTWTGSFYNDTLSIEPGIGEVPLESDENGLVVSPTETTTYTLFGTDWDGNEYTLDTLTIYVGEQKPTVSLTADPSLILTAGIGTSLVTAELSWNSTWADYCTIEPDIGRVDANGSVIVTLDNINEEGEEGEEGEEEIITEKGC